MYFLVDYVSIPARMVPPPLGPGVCETKSKKGRSRHTQNASFTGFTILGGGLRPWSQTMISEGARPWGRGRARVLRSVRMGFCQNGFLAIFIVELPEFFPYNNGPLLVARIFSCSWEKSAQKNPRKSPAKSSNFYTAKIPDTFLQRARAKNCYVDPPV